MRSVFFFGITILFVLCGFLTALNGAAAIPLLSAFAMVLLALPSFVVVIRSCGAWGWYVLVALGLFAFLIETVGVLTGFPYGHFQYSSALGSSLCVVPWTVFFGWTPFVLGAVALSQRLMKTRVAQFGSAVVLLVLIDLVLDPGAVLLGFWSYATPGWYYGVPWTNYAGWVFSGTIGVFLTMILIRTPNLPGAVLWSTYCGLLFWTVLVATRSLWFPAALGLLLCILFGMFLRPDQRVSRRRVRPRAGVRSLRFR